MGYLHATRCLYFALFTARTIQARPFNNRSSATARRQGGGFKIDRESKDIGQHRDRCISLISEGVIRSIACAVLCSKRNRVPSTNACPPRVLWLAVGDPVPLAMLCRSGTVNIFWLPWFSCRLLPSGFFYADGLRPAVSVVRSATDRPSVQPCVYMCSRRRTPLTLRMIK